MPDRTIARLTVALIALAMTGCATLAPGAPATRGVVLRLDSIFADTSLAQGFIGVEVRDAETGRVLYEHNSDKVFTPASNMKIYTGAAALMGLGPDYVYETRVSASGPIRNGVLDGSLVVFGTGDPTITERFHEDPRDVFRSWADSLRMHGIERIAGSIIGVDSAFPGPTLGNGWGWNDLDAYYASEYGALQYNEGAIRVDVHPGAIGARGNVVLRPGTQYVPVINNTVTVGPGERTTIQVSREEIGPGFVVDGQIASDTSVGRDVAVRDPAMFFLTAMREGLRDAGIAVDGPAITFRELDPSNQVVDRGLLLFSYKSAPMSEILPAMMKPSQNWIAETLLMTVGRELGEAGTARGGAAVMDSMLTAWGLDTNHLIVRDGSGLSRYNLISPDLTADLLAYMRNRSPYSDIWVASMPVGGEDGTLRSRMQDPPLHGNVRAKTGTLNWTRSLSGYLTTRSGRTLIFSTLVNNHARTAGTVDRVVEAALETLATEF